MTSSLVALDSRQQLPALLLLLRRGAPRRNSSSRQLLRRRTNLNPHTGDAAGCVLWVWGALQAWGWRGGCMGVELLLLHAGDSGS